MIPSISIFVAVSPCFFKISRTAHSSGVSAASSLPPTPMYLPSWTSFGFLLRNNSKILCHYRYSRSSLASSSAFLLVPFISLKRYPCNPLQNPPILGVHHSVRTRSVHSFSCSLLMKERKRKFYGFLGILHRVKDS